MRQALSRASIVSATRDLIIQRGAHDVSLREVGRALGVTAPALYAHVDDKQDLLAAVAAGEFEKLASHFEVAMALDPDPVAQIRSTSRAYIEFALENPELFRLMFLFPPAAFAGDEPALEAATRAFDLPASAMRNAIESGAVHSIEPDVAVLMQWAACHGVADVLLMDLGFDSDTFPAVAGAVIDALLDTMIRGLQA